jgi:hypothetical protein
VDIKIVISYSKIRWRVLHELELPSWRRIAIQPGRPEVRPFFHNHFVEFGERWQWLSYYGNQPWLTPQKWTAFYGNNLWITNDQGFGESNDPRRNYVLPEDLDADELPKTEVITCGGNILSGYRDGNDIVVDMLDVHGSLPSLPWIKEHREFCTYAVTVDSGLKPRRFPQGQQPNDYMPDLFHPMIADTRRFIKITIPAWRVVEWTNPEPPDLYTIYRPA